MSSPTQTMYVFYCSRNFHADDLRGAGSGDGGRVTKTVALPCSGKVDVPYLMKAFENDADGVVIVACQKDECRNFEGSPRASKRAAAVEALLEEIGIPSKRITVFECGEGGTPQVLDEIAAFAEGLRDAPFVPASHDGGG